jgi:plasmid stabilization system protein ParE
MIVRWSDEATTALETLEANLAKRYSAEKAERVVNNLVRRVAQLADHPELGRIVPEHGHRQLRELVDNWNRVLYQLGPDGIEIVTIVPARLPLTSSDPEND